MLDATNRVNMIRASRISGAFAAIGEAVWSTLVDDNLRARYGEGTPPGGEGNSTVARRDDAKSPGLTCLGWCCDVFLGDPLSRSGPPRLGLAFANRRPLASARKTKDK